MHGNFASDPLLEAIFKAEANKAIADTIAFIKELNATLSDKPESEWDDYMNSRIDSLGGRERWQTVQELIVAVDSSRKLIERFSKGTTKDAVGELSRVVLIAGLIQRTIDNKPLGDK